MIVTLPVLTVLYVHRTVILRSLQEVNMLSITGWEISTFSMFSSLQTLIFVFSFDLFLLFTTPMSSASKGEEACLFYSLRGIAE